MENKWGYKPCDGEPGEKEMSNHYIRFIIHRICVNLEEEIKGCLEFANPETILLQSDEHLVEPIKKYIYEQYQGILENFIQEYDFFQKEFAKHDSLLQEIIKERRDYAWKERDYKNFSSTHRRLKKKMIKHSTKLKEDLEELSKELCLKHEIKRFIEIN